MFREIRRSEKITDRFENEEKGFMNIKPQNGEHTIEELHEIVKDILKEAGASVKNSRA